VTDDEQQEDGVAISLSGELMHEHANELRQHLQATLSRKPERVRVSLAEVGRLTSTCKSVLVGTTCLVRE
jgi:ABC-type transporter Mla MlaB component